MFVQRRNGLSDGAIIGAFANFQPVFAEEWLDDDDPELVAFLNPSTKKWRSFAQGMLINPGYVAMAQAATGNSPSGDLAVMHLASAITQPEPIATILVTLWNQAIAELNPEQLPTELIVNSWNELATENNIPISFGGDGMASVVQA